MSKILARKTEQFEIGISMDRPEAEALADSLSEVFSWDMNWRSDPAQLRRLMQQVQEVTGRLVEYPGEPGI